MNQSFYCLDLGITKCYLLACADGYLLIDTGYSSDYHKFVKIMNKLGIVLSKIKYLLLTHHHDDHAGFAAHLVKAAGCRLIVHKNAVVPLKNGVSLDSMSPVNKRIKFVFSAFLLFHKNFEYPSVDLSNSDVIISDDQSEILRQIGINGKIIYTPGHTDDSISVVLDNGNAFVGDAAMNFLQWCGIKYRPIYIDNIEEVYKSWNRLKEYGAKKIYPAHGKPFLINKLFTSQTLD
ncbi:MBL fold metallo-hydrolase [Cellulosilyticum sp. I15G10I2]|uniref:MBL fold metallo-hydrolase n=1 Tax=Cellulosilyticum sp. I15G10I2 TaxID=1892843 RepID=UPI00085C737E|nr:MBL fold metallo-hydrolase [Cellulosilyticum sp. I15G10I2]